MLISIIICTRDRAASLSATLTSLASVTIPEGADIELAIIDNGSRDNTRSVVESFRRSRIQVGYHGEPHCGQALARNLGLVVTQGELILFTDDDVRFPVNWICAMTQPMVGTNVSAVAGSIRMAPHLERPWMTEVHRAWLATNDRAAGPSELIGANMAFRRRVLASVPGFDTELGPGALGYGDDTLFSLQLRNAGHQIVGERSAPVEHNFTPDRLLYSSWLAAARRFGQTQAYLLHHWDHSRISNIHCKLAISALRFFALRALRRPELKLREGITERELYTVQRFHRHTAYLRIRAQPRKFPMCGGGARLVRNGSLLCSSRLVS